MKITSQMRDAQVKRDAVLRIVLASGIDGMTMDEVKAKTGYSRSSVGIYLRLFRDQKLVECSMPKGGITNRWGAIGIRAAYLKNNAEKLVKYEALMARRQFLLERRMNDEREAEAFARESFVRIVPAHLAEPLRPRGPSSVWDLAA